MMRYRVQVSRPEIRFIDAETPELAIEQAIALSQSRAAPDYFLAPVAHIEVVAEVVDRAAV